MSAMPRPLPRRLVFDLEATCSNDGSVPRRDAEIIEIGAVLVDESFRELGRFSTFVRPTTHPLLTPFCTQITGIVQADVDQAPRVGAALEALFQELPEAIGVPYMAWGQFDRVLVEREARRGRTGAPFGPYEDALRLFAKRHVRRPNWGLAQALLHAGLTFEGPRHRALSDAINLRSLMAHLIAD